MKAITLRALWAWAVVHGPKRVENRNWRTSRRGEIAIHAGVDRAHDDADRRSLVAAGVDVPDDVPRGAVLGTVELLDVVDYPAAGDPDPYGLRDDPLATGPVCWILGDPRPLARPVPARGLQRFWSWDPD